LRLARQSCPAVFPGSLDGILARQLNISYSFRLVSTCLLDLVVYECYDNPFRLAWRWLYSDIKTCGHLKQPIGLGLRTDLSLVTTSINCKLSFQQKEETFGLRLFSTLLPKMATLATVWIIFKHPVHCPSKHRTNDFQ
jgi:hypothetical protein